MSARLSLEDHIAAHRASPAPAPKKRAKSKRPEDVLHVAVAKFLTAVIARPGDANEFGAVWFSIEGRGKRSLREGAANKARGVISGVPDIAIYHAGRAFFIELKAEKGVVSSSQYDLHHVLARAKIPVLIARDIPTIAKVLDTWGIPHKRSVVS